MDVDVKNTAEEAAAKAIEAAKESETLADPIAVPEPEEDAKSTGVGTDILRVLADTRENLEPLNVLYGARILAEDVKQLLGLDSKSSELEAQQQAFKKFFRDNPISGFDQLLNAFNKTDDIYTPEGDVKPTETTAGAVAEFVPYVIGGTKVYKELGERGSKYIRGLAAGAVTDAVLSDVEDGTLADVVGEYFPETQSNVIIEYMSSNENDSKLKAKSKVVLEGAVIGGAIDIVLTTPKILKYFGIGAIESVKYLSRKSKQLYGKPVEQLELEEKADVMLEVLEEAKINTQFKQQSQVTDVQLTETPEGSAQVALQNSSKLHRFVNRFFTTRGYFTPKGYNAFEDSEYAKRQTIAKAENIALRLQKSIDEMAESTDQEEVIETINKLFTQDLKWLKGTKEDKIIDLADKYNLTDVQAEEFLNARELIDDMSNELIGSTSVSDSLKETIQENVGEYIRRSYRLFEDSGYVPTPEVQKDATDYIYRNILDNKPDISEAFAYQEAVDTVKEILKQGDQAEFSDYFSNLKKINKDILKKQETIPLEIRRLMGEVEQPSENIILTVSKMTNLVNSTKFYNNLEQLGHSGGYIFRKGEPRPEGYDTKIAGTNSKLDGQFTTPEIFDELQNNTSHFFTNGGSKYYKEFLSFKGQAQKLKTVYSHMTHIRNLTGGMQFGFANGVNPFGGGANETRKVLLDSILKRGDKSFNNTYEKYLRLGIINTNVRVNEFRAILESGYETNIDGFQKKVGSSLDKIGLTKNRREFFDNLYVATDDFYKINYFNQELSLLQKAYPDVAPDVLEEQAANIVRNTMPNYDRVPKGVKSLRQLPVGSFFSFPAEIIRTSAHIARQSAKEMQSTNPLIRDRGLKRMAGFTVTTMAFGQVADMSAKLAGFNEEEQKAIAILSETPWSNTAPRNIVKIDGKIYTNDTQYIDSYSALKDPLRSAAYAWSKGEINEDEFEIKVLDSTAAFAYSFFKPYIDEAILTSAITDVTLAALNEDGRTPNGKEIFTPGLTVAEKSANVLQHLGKTLVPGSALSIKSLIDTMNEKPNRTTGKTKSKPAELVANMTGVKFTEVDIESAIKFAVSDFKRDSSLSITTGINFERNSDEVIKRYKQQQKVRLKSYKELYRTLKAAEYLIDEDEVYSFALENGLSRKDLAAISMGYFKPSRPPQKSTVALEEKTPNVTSTKQAINVSEELEQVYLDLWDIRLNDPITGEKKGDQERLQKVMGGVVDKLVPNAPENPSDRINKVTGMPYNLEAGAAYLEESDPIRSLVMAAGGRVRKSSGGEMVANLVGISKEDLEWAKSQDKRYSKSEELDGKGDAARHLALGWITQRAENPDLALKAANFRENLSLRRLDKPMDQHNNNLGATIKANTFKEAEAQIDKLIADKEAMYMTPSESDRMRGYSKGSLVAKMFFAPKKSSGLYSAAEKASQKLEGSKPREGQAFLNEIKKDPDVTDEELKWTKANEKFANDKKVTKEEVQEFFKENDFDFDVAVGRSDVDRPDADFKVQPEHLNYSFEGENTQNYRELVLSIPDKYKKVDLDFEYEDHHPQAKNQFAHVRLSDIQQTDDAFNTTLLVDEIQSDAHQRATGKSGKGYYTIEDEKLLKEKKKEITYTNDFIKLSNEKENLVDKLDQLDDMIDDEIITEAEYIQRRDTIQTRIGEVNKDLASADDMLAKEDEFLDLIMKLETKTPELPLKQGKQWGAAGLRQAMKVAAEEGYDQVALTTGQLQAIRNNKIGNIKEALLFKKQDIKTGEPRGWAIQGVNTDDEFNDFLVVFDTFEEAVQKLPKVLGKENAEKLLASTPDDAGEYALKQPMTMKMGGQKYIDFYDGTLQKIWKRDFADKYDVDIEMIKYNQGDKTVELPTLKITDKMREDILKGLKMFVSGGLVEETLHNLKGARTAND